MVRPDRNLGLLLGSSAKLSLISASALTSTVSPDSFSFAAAALTTTVARSKAVTMLIGCAGTGISGDQCRQSDWNDKPPQPNPSLDVGEGVLSRSWVTFQAQCMVRQENARRVAPHRRLGGELELRSPHSILQQTHFADAGLLTPVGMGCPRTSSSPWPSASVLFEQALDFFPG